MKRVEIGLNSLVLIIIEFPQASAGAAFMARVMIGAWKGQMPAQMPHGCRTVYCDHGEAKCERIFRRSRSYLEARVCCGHDPCLK
jgi:hypothetical protein